MLAAVLKELSKPLRIEEVKTPSPGSNEVLIQVMACGTDATDLKLIDGFGYAPDLPFITGHEIAGVVSELGDQVTDFKPGDRVVAHNFFTCGKCLLCRTNREQLCIDMAGVMGARIKHGGHAEYVLVPARQLVSVPEGVPWVDAAVCCDAGITAFHAVDRAGVSLGETVVVVGVGGVGSVVTQLAKAAGAYVIAIDRLAVKVERGLEMGADVALNSSEKNIESAVRELTDGLGADCVIDVVGNKETLTYGVNALRHGGRLLVVGYTPELYGLSGRQFAQNELMLIGSRCGRLQDLASTVRLVAEGRIKSIVTDLYPLEKINYALDDLRASKVLGRAVLLTPAGRKAMGQA